MHHSVSLPLWELMTIIRGILESHIRYQHLVGRDRQCECQIEDHISEVFLHYEVKACRFRQFRVLVVAFADQEEFFTCQLLQVMHLNQQSIPLQLLACHQDQMFISDFETFRVYHILFFVTLFKEAHLSFLFGSDLFEN